MTGSIPSGVWTAIITPFENDGSLDLVSYEKLLARQIEAGIDGVVVFGTTGESPTLSVQEKLSVLKKTKAIVGNKLSIMAGSGGNNTNQTVELSKLCEDAGADSLLVVTPPYNKPGLNGLKAHYQSISDAVNIPLMLYHVPSRTGSFLDADVLLDVLENPQIQAVKEASGDINYFSKTAMKANCKFLSGDDFTYLPSLAVGGKGVVSVVTNIFPEAFVRMTHYYFHGELEKALKIHNCLFQMIELLFKEPNPAPTKGVLNLMGLCKNNLRLPLTKITEANYQELKLQFEKTTTELSELV